VINVRNRQAAVSDHRDDCILDYSWDGVMSKFTSCKALAVAD